MQHHNVRSSFGGLTAHRSAIVLARSVGLRMSPRGSSGLGLPPRHGPFCDTLVDIIVPKFGGCRCIGFCWFLAFVLLAGWHPVHLHRRPLLARTERSDICFPRIMSRAWPPHLAYNQMGLRSAFPLSGFGVASTWQRGAMLEPRRVAALRAECGVVAGLLVECYVAVRFLMQL